MANTLFSDVMLSEAVKFFDRKTSIFGNFVTHEFEWELRGKASVVSVPVMANIVLTGQDITAGATIQTLGTWPWAPIALSPSTLTLENLTLKKFAPYRTSFTEFELRHGKVAIESVVGKNVAGAKDDLLDDYIRDLILVDKVASIPAANKINSGAPVTIIVSNVFSEIGKMFVALDKQKAKWQRVLVVSSATADMIVQSKLLINSDMPYKDVMNGYLWEYRKCKIYQSTGLDASNEMIMFVDWCINAVIETYGSKSKEWDDGFYLSFFTEIVYWWDIFTPNLVKVAINYCA